MSDRATGARCLVVARPVEYGRVRGDKGACPRMLPPPLGERGGQPRSAIHFFKASDMVVPGSLSEMNSGYFVSGKYEKSFSVFYKNFALVISGSW